MSAPQTGALLQHSERALHWAPAVEQVGGAAQVPLVHARPEQQGKTPHEEPTLPHWRTQRPWPLRMRPAQQSAALFAHRPSAAQTLRHEAAPELEPAHTGLPAQHAAALEPQRVPGERQVAPVEQVPLVQARPAQHGTTLQLSPAARQVGPDPQTPPLHVRPEQHGVVGPQVSPAGRQVVGGRHWKFTQARPWEAQQSVEVAHWA